MDKTNLGCKNFPLVVSFVLFPCVHINRGERFYICANISKRRYLQ